MNPIDLFLSRVDAKPSGKYKWKCRCPAHDDRSPSLSIAEGKDGVVLLHCFAGCEVADIVESVGLTLGDLFPSDTRKQPLPTKQDFKNELIHIELAQAIRKQGLHMDELTMNRVELAIHRIETGKKLGVIS